MRRSTTPIKQRQRAIAPANQANNENPQ